MTGWLIDTALYTGLLIGAVLLLRRPVARTFGPGMAYALWALPLLRFILPPIVLPASLAPQQAVIEPVVYTPAFEAPVEAVIPMVLPVEPAWAWTDAILPVWLAGAALLLAWRIVSYRRMRRDLLRGASPVGESGRIRLVETPAVTSPVAFGVRDKVVALPPRFMAMEDRAARDLAIAHEIAHHRGRDVLANFAAQPLLAMHWFNPLAWAGWRAMRRDQEAACDARVLAGRDADERVAYARLIAGFAAGPRLALAAPMACPMIGEKSIIHRLRSLSMIDISTRRRWFGRFLFGTAAVALPLTASISYAQGEPVTVTRTDIAPSTAVVAGDDADGEKHVRVFKLIRDGDAAELDGDTDIDIDIDSDEVADGKVKEKRVFRIRRPDGKEGETQVFAWDSDKPLSEEQRAKLDEMMARIKEGKAVAVARNHEMLALRSEELAKRHTDMAMRFTDIEKSMPRIEMKCGDKTENGTRSWTDESGRNHVIICERAMVARAAMSLRQARQSIANNRDMNAEVRDEVLRELDEEIVRIEKQEG